MLADFLIWLSKMGPLAFTIVYALEVYNRCHYQELCEELQHELREVKAENKALHQTVRNLLSD